ncbi:MAG: flavin reductase family protein [Collimonas sp.]
MNTNQDQDKLRDDMLQAMRRLAKSVSVITCSHGGQRHAMSASAVDSLSTAPPSLLICVNQSCSIYTPLSRGAPFCVNILAADQCDIAQICAGKLKGEARFSEGSWHTHADGTPYLAEAQANLICEQDGHYDYGTHTIFIGRIKRVLVGGPVSPLVYVDGAYATSAALTQNLAYA